MILDDIVNEISNANSIVILTHENPDGDAIGSSLGLYLVLKGLNKDVSVLMPEHPKMFDYLPGASEIKTSLDENIYDVAISLDCSDLKRLNGYSNYFESAKVKICIDHHISNTMYADYNFVNHESSSTCQMLILLITYLQVSITKEVAECLYTGILTDTGGFRYNTTVETFECAEILFNTGINIAKITEKSLDTMTKPRMKLTIAATNRIEFFEDEKIAFLYITKEEEDKFGAQDGDHDGIVNFGINIENVCISIFLRETKDGYKVSLRSRGDISVADMALIFGGGGHKNAAGCTINKGFEDTKNSIIKEAKRYLKE